MSAGIGLTGRDRRAMNAVAMQLTRRSTDNDLAITLFLDVRGQAEAQAVLDHGGELWRIGQDLTQPELDALLSRQIDSDTDGDTLQARVDHALGLYLAGRTAAAGATP